MDIRCCEGEAIETSNILLTCTLVPVINWSCASLVFSVIAHTKLLYSDNLARSANLTMLYILAIYFADVFSLFF